MPISSFRILLAIHPLQAVLQIRGGSELLF
jgi:hypothetical protein